MRNRWHHTSTKPFGANIPNPSLDALSTSQHFDMECHTLFTKLGRCHHGRNHPPRNHEPCGMDCSSDRRLYACLPQIRSYGIYSPYISIPPLSDEYICMSCRIGYSLHRNWNLCYEAQFSGRATVDVENRYPHLTAQTIRCRTRQLRRRFWGTTGSLFRRQRAAGKRKTGSRMSRSSIQRLFAVWSGNRLDRITPTTVLDRNFHCKSDSPRESVGIRIAGYDCFRMFFLSMERVAFTTALYDIARRSKPKGTSNAG